jgi:peptidoglycan glycosyltransferase
MFLKSNKKFRIIVGLFFITASTLLLFWALSDLKLSGKDTGLKEVSEIRSSLAQQLGPFFQQNKFPTEAEIEWYGSLKKAHLTYTIDNSLQNRALKLIQSYRPDFAAVVILDADTGAVKAMASYQKGASEVENLNLRSSFPAASIFKIVTATAAIDKKNLDPDHIVLFNGQNHTLYKKNVMSPKINRWTREMTLEEAFAKSVNTVFGRISLENLDPSDLKEYAIRFGFNKHIESDLPFDPGFASIPEDKSYQLTEAASGFNRLTTMSPIQGAMIAASIANEGVMKVPYVVDHIKDTNGKVLFSSEPVVAAITMNKTGAEKLKKLMSATITKGTSKKSFLPFLRDRKVNDIEVGGKTGSITGGDPKGKVDWFVGYAIGDTEKLAIAAVTVNVKYWTVKSSYLAQSLFKSYFKNLELSQRTFSSQSPSAEVKN